MSGGSFLLVLVFTLACVASVPPFGKVTQLPGVNFSVPFEQFSGNLVVNQTCPAYVYAWVAKASNGNANAPVVMFLNGGPGSSTFLAWFFETIGPFLIVDPTTPTLSLNPYAWNQNVDLIMFDQPAGVGLSFVSSPNCYPTNVAQSTQQLASAVEQLFAMPQVGLAGKPLYVFGESYAGTYVPLLTKALQQSGKVKLGGMGIGDGWVNPLVQQSTYAVYAESHGLISGDEVRQTQHLISKCAAAIKSYPPNAPLPSSVNDACNLIEEYIVNISSCNVYDVRSTDQYDFSALSTYLNRVDVVDALNVDRRALPWTAGSDAIGNLFAVGEQNSYASVYGDLWSGNQPVRTLVYNGIYDMDCGFMGTDAWLAALSNWSGAKKLTSMGRLPWTLYGSIHGMLRSVAPVQQLLVYGAGHLVPYDQPFVAREMMEQFVIAGGLKVNATKQK